MALNIPLPGANMETFFKGGEYAQSMIDSFLQNQQKQKQLQQEALANQQLNQNNLFKQGIEQQKLPGVLELQKQQAANQQAQAGYHSSPYRTDLLKAQIDSQKALAEQRKAGGGTGTSVQSKDIQALTKQIIDDNRGISPQDAGLIADARLSGKNTLPNGQPLPNLGGRAESLVDQILKRRSTSALVNQAVNASQSEAELSVLDKYAQEGLAPYGDTILNMNSRQIVDTFNNDKESQERLGKLIGSQALQFEIAQIRNRIAMGQPGITSTQEMMHMSGQLIDTKFPMLSARARKVASEYINKALKEGLNARKKVGINASAAIKPVEEEASDIDKGRMTVIIDGEEYKIRRDKLDAAREKYPNLTVKKEKFGAA